MTTRASTRSSTRGLLRVATGLGPNLRSFRWSMRQLRDVRARLRREGTRTRVPVAEGMGPRGRWGVYAAVAVKRPTCLERSLLIQAWLGGHTVAPDVVIGVRNGQGAIEAHAWVDGTDPWFDPSYVELARLPR